MRNSVALRNALWQHPFQRRGRARLLATLLGAAIILPAIGNAQQSAAIRRIVPQSNAPAASGRRNAQRQRIASPPAAQTSRTPSAAPPAPQWPVNDPPRQATVTWTEKGLSIDARNSSLQQILAQVTAQTGAKIEGLDKDVRVYGVYGPGQPRDVLSELLEGTNYNVLMVGDGERGVPQQIVLSVKPAGGPQPNAPVPPGEMYQPPIAPYQPPPRPMPPQQQQPLQPPRTPQQLLQEMQQRQLLMREQQMQQQRQQQQQQQQ